MSQLVPIRQRLAALRQRRRLVRWGTAGAAAILAVLLVLGLLFALDVTLELSLFQRALMSALGLGLIAWAGQRYVGPLLGQRETEIDVALRVEREQGIDTDLVAALQFEQPVAAGWGSLELESAVVSRIAELAPRLDVFRGLDYGQLRRRAAWAGSALLVALLVTAIYPRHVAVFFHRLCFSSRHYPSDTIIENLYVNRAHVLQWNAASLEPLAVKSAQGQPVTFLLHGTGILPPAGVIECRSKSNREAKSLELRRLAADETRQVLQTAIRVHAVNRSVAADGEGSSADAGPRLEKLLADLASDQPGLAVYAAELPRLVEDFEYSVRLGDAWTDPALVRMIELPAIETALQVEPPVYARHVIDKPSSPRHVAVLEGSRVGLTVRAVNGKRLHAAVIRFAVAGQSSQLDLVQQDTEGLVWSLPAVESPLLRVTQEVRYEIQVRDTDGLGLESPLHGFIQLKPDRPPTALAQVVHRVVLPAAKPVIEYRMSDDYGVATAVLLAQIERGAARADTEPAATDGTARETQATALPEIRVPIPLDPQPVLSQNLPYRGTFPLDLTPFQLHKGDQLKLTLEVSDYRGPAAGKSFLSEPILVEISDEAGVLSAITEADERSEKRLNDVIQQQLGVGGTP